MSSVIFVQRVGVSSLCVRLRVPWFRHASIRTLKVQVGFLPKGAAVDLTGGLERPEASDQSHSRSHPDGAFSVEIAGRGCPPSFFFNGLGWPSSGRGL